MPRQSSKEPLRKHTLFLFDGDFDRLNELYPEVTASVMIRTIVRRFLNKVDPEVDSTQLPKLEVDIDL